MSPDKSRHGTTWGEPNKKPMSEPTITCPNCNTVIKLTKSMNAPLKTTGKQYEQQLA